MLLFAYGRWHKPAPNEPLIPSGWERHFEIIAGGRAPLGMHCSMVLVYKNLDFERIATGEVVEAISISNYARAVQQAMQVFQKAPEETIELDALPLQIAASAVLSRYEIVKVELGLDSATFSSPKKLTPINILRALYEMGENGQLRVIINPGDWEAIRRISLHKIPIKPENGLAILEGDEGVVTELLSFLKVQFPKGLERKSGG
ncbi:MAG: hypothetical protein QXG35_02460 [Nitrososphaerota archaeon]